nr:DNA polymerase III subunit chi [uncultured Pantoea sp.]
MKNATFYVLESESASDGLSAIEALVCDLAAARWREGKRILIACESEAQANRLDEALWQRPANAFVPHNLAGEGPRYGAPVELAWPQRRSSAPRDLLISLLPAFADFATGLPEVIGVVTSGGGQKQPARGRDEAFRSGGFQLKTAPPPPPQTT